jgi:transcriptional regulator GlxA family with amidase domain
MDTHAPSTLVDLLPACFSFEKQIKGNHEMPAREISAGGRFRHCHRTPPEMPSDQLVLIDLILLDGLDLFDLGAFTDAFALANEMQDKLVISCRITSPGGRPVMASNGIVIEPADDTYSVSTTERLLLFGGETSSLQAPEPLLSWVRKRYAEGAVVGSCGSATHILALSGLLDRNRCASHWANTEEFKTRYPRIDFQKQLFISDGRFLTCSGGRTSLDLALSVVHQLCGNLASRRVADHLNCERIRDDLEQQRTSAEVTHPSLSLAIEIMHDHVEGRFALKDIARRVGVTTRQLQRLFRKHVNMTPLEYHVVQRLWRARGLLLRSQLSVNEVAAAIGFSSPSHFSRCYRRQFRHRPSDDRSDRLFGSNSRCSEKRGSCGSP